LIARYKVIAGLRHHAPVLGGKADAMLAVHGVLRIEVGELVGARQRHEIGEAVAAVARRRRANAAWFR
jgi:hypothetical protein